MPLPVAAVDEDDGLILRKHDVGSAGELFVERSVDCETETPPVEERPEQALGLGRVKGCTPRDRPVIRDMTQLRFSH